MVISPPGGAARNFLIADSERVTRQISYENKLFWFFQQWVTSHGPIGVERNNPGIYTSPPPLEIA